jgi:hypothetical protein
VLLEAAGDVGSQCAIAAGRKGDEEVDEPDAACGQSSLGRGRRCILQDIGDD